MELRDAWRGLRAAPGTSALAFAILTLGIAAATVTFSVVDAVALRELPLPQPHRLAAVAVERTDVRLGVVAPQDFYTWREQVPAFDGVAGVGQWFLTLTEGGASERLTAYRITANLFDVLGVRPALGTGFTSANEVAGSEQVVIVSHAFWMRRLGGQRDAIGRPLTFGKETKVVVGVMPPGFTYPIGPAQATDVWVPNVPRPQDRDHGFAGRSYYLQVVARLRPGATIDEAQDQVSRATAAVIAAYPTQVFWKDATPVVVSLHDAIVGSAQGWLVLLLGAVALVLVVAYINVANLLLARAASRARELAMRATLGASRARIARTLALESLMLSVGAALVGIALAKAGVVMATASLPAGLARASTIALDLRVLTVAIVAAIITGLVFGAVPAWHGSRADVMSVIKEGGSVIGAGRGRARWQRLLLVAELAFVVALLVSVSLFVTSFVNVLRTDLGFARGNLVGFGISKALTAAKEEREPAREAIVSDLLTRVAAVPGVAGAAIVDGGLPLFGPRSSYGIEIEGYGRTTGADSVVLKAVTTTFFDVAGMRFVRGRGFDGSERAGTPHVMVINEEAARRFFRDRDPVGQVVTFRGPTTIVGVVASMRISGPEQALRPEMFVPILHEDVGNTSLSGDVLVRFAGSSASIPAVQAALEDFTSRGTPPAPQSIDEQFRTLTADRRFNAGLMTLFGILALGMAAAGVYGLTSFVVAQQRRVIGVRLALGATTGRIFRDVLVESGRLLAASLTIGLLGGWAASRLFASVVFGVTGGEPWLYAFVALTIALTVLAATILPARRAARVDPLVALRAD